VAAGAVGLATPAVTQTAMPASPAAGPVVKTASVGTLAPADPGQFKLEEMQAELALLASPATFAYNLGCNRTETGMEVSGYVSSNAARTMVLEIVKQHCSVPVVDKMQLNGALMPRAAAGTIDEMKKGAADLLAESFGRTASGMEIRASDRGHLVLSGACESYEQKVEFSKRLRALHGCCAVENNLTVKPVMRDGRTVALVTANGSFTVAAAGSASGVTHTQTARNTLDSLPPLPPATPVTPPKPAPVVSAAPAVAKMDRATLPPTPIKNDLPTLPPMSPTPSAPKPDVTAVASAKSDKPAPPMKLDAVPPAPAKLDALPPVPTKIDALPPAPKKIDPPAPPATKVETPAPLATKIETSAPPATKIETPAPVATKIAPPVPPPSPLTKVPAFADGPGSSTVQAKATDGSSRVVPAVSAAPVKTTTPAGAQWPSAYEGKAPPAVAPVAKAPAPEPKPAPAAYTTSGVVQFDEPLPEPPPLLKAENMLQLKRKVEGVCGALAKDVIVTSGQDGLIHVLVKTSFKEENKRMTQEILELPDMAAPNVRLEVKLVN
jgi:hypothetical protein